MKSKRQLSKQDWPEEKILRNGTAALTNIELLAAFIGSGVKGADAKTIARNLLAAHGCRLLTLNASEFTKTTGIGATKAAKLKALFELACRLSIGNTGESLAQRLTHVRDNETQYCLADLLSTHNLNMPHSLNRTHLEFFAGIGLVRYALENQGWSVLYANDIDEGKKRMYADHFGEDTTFDCRDIHCVDPSSLPYATLATASFPCTDLSLAGGRTGLSGKQSSAFWGFINVLRGMGEKKPPVVMLENVTGFLSSRQGQDFEDALLALNRLGYSVDAFVVDAVHFVPQSRRRLFVVALQHHIEMPNESELALAQTELRPSALTTFVSTHRNIQWRLRCLPRLPERCGDIKSIVEDIPENDVRWWSKERVSYLLSQMSSRHRETAQGMMSRRQWSYGTVFRRVRHGLCRAELRSDGVAGCLRTPKGGSAKQILLKAGHDVCKCRLLTPQECARLMGADKFLIRSTPDQALFGFGDAVCVPVIEWIAANYLNQLTKVVERQHLPASA